MKISVLGCGLRTPLLLHGLAHSGLAIEQISLYDIDPSRSGLMAALGTHIAETAKIRIRAHFGLEQAVEGSDFVINGIRVGNMETRASDERLAMDCGFAGQETTGPAGFAMALRTIPVVLEQARIIQRHAPSAWIVNFTDPAGLITQAISTLTGANVVGVCDTPAELFYQIARALNEDPAKVQCDYFGLNHLGWVRGVRVGTRNRIAGLLDDERLLRALYPAELFPTCLLRSLKMLPTEYLFFYYNQHLALQNQRRAGATRGEELNTLNRQIWAELEHQVREGDGGTALASYRRYLNRRNASYMHLEAEGGSAFQVPDPDWDPFEGATGYHRIAVETIAALVNGSPRPIVLNVPNQGSIEGLAAEDVVEVPCLVDESGARPLAVGALPESVRGLVISMKHFERLTIEAAVEQRWDCAVYALMNNPIVGNWNAARDYLRRLSESDSQHFAAFKRRDILQSNGGL